MKSTTSDSTHLRQCFQYASNPGLGKVYAKTLCLPAEAASSNGTFVTWLWSIGGQSQNWTTEILCLFSCRQTPWGRWLSCLQRGITTWNQSKVLNVQRDGARVRHSQDAQQRGDSRPTQHSHGSLCAHWQLRWLHQDCLALVPAVPSPCIGHWSALVSSHCRWLRREKQNPQSSLKFLNACFDKMALLMQKWPVDFWAQHTCPYHCWHPWSIDPYAGLDTFTWGQLC